MVQIHSSTHKSGPIVRFPSILFVVFYILISDTVPKIEKKCNFKYVFSVVGPSRSLALPLLFLHTFWRPIVKKKKFRKSKAVVRQVPRDILAQFQSASWMIRSNCQFLTRATQNLK